MEAIGNRLQNGMAWLSLPSSLLNVSIFDSFAIPFSDNQLSTSGSVQQTISEPVSSRLVYMDQTGREMNDEEVEAFGANVLSDSPWGFIASRYAVTLGIMAVVINRITHICRPQGRPRPLATYKRLGIQMPTMLFLTWSGLLLLMVTLNSFFPQSLLLQKIISFPLVPKDIVSLTLLDASKEDVRAANSALLWRLFLSVCLAVISSTLLRTLEGHNAVVNPDDIGNSPTLNLVGFAVLLHLHASSYTFPPNRHVYLGILFQVGEVLGLQACTCWVVPPVSRLTLTSIFGLTSTIHYVAALRSGDRGFPFLQSFSRAPDVALIAVIFLTLSLHALTAIITETPLSFSRLIDPRSLPLPSDDYSLALFKLGTACLNSTRLSGLDADLIDIRTSNEPWIEVDAGQVRVREPDGRVATLLNAQQGGFNQEIRMIRTKKNQTQGSSFRSPLWHERWKFFVTLLKTLKGAFVIMWNKIALFLPFEVPAIRFPLWVRQLPRRLRLLWHGTNGEERRSQRLNEERRRQEHLSRIAETQQATHRDGAGRAFASATSSAISTHSFGNASRNRAMSPSIESNNSWNRLFQQHFAEDEDDDDWNDEGNESEVFSRDTTPLPLDRAFTDTRQDYWNGVGMGSRLSDVAVEEDNETDDNWTEDEDNAKSEIEMSAELLALARRDFDSDVEDRHAYTQILMAHLSSTQQSPLTRHGYRQMQVGSSLRTNGDAQMLAQLIAQRRQAASSIPELDERERSRLCVICYVEDRTIICWPCKCLALCDGCREAMASRPPPRNGQPDHRHNAPSPITHTCPTCRTPVIGFSRIFLP